MSNPGVSNLGVSNPADQSRILLTSEVSSQEGDHRSRRTRRRNIFRICLGVHRLPPLTQSSDTIASPLCLNSHTPQRRCTLCECVDLRFGSFFFFAGAITCTGCDKSSCCLTFQAVEEIQALFDRYRYLLDDQVFVKCTVATRWTELVVHQIPYDCILR